MKALNPLPGVQKQNPPFKGGRILNIILKLKLIDNYEDGKLTMGISSFETYLLPSTLPGLNNVTSVT